MKTSTRSDNQGCGAAEYGCREAEGNENVWCLLQLQLCVHGVGGGDTRGAPKAWP